jgi:hypothetical protein
MQDINFSIDENEYEIKKSYAQKIKEKIKVMCKQVSYSDYKKTEDGYVFPYVQTIEAGSIVFKSIEVNKPIDEKIFTVD